MIIKRLIFIFAICACFPLCSGAWTLYDGAEGTGGEVGLWTTERSTSQAHTGSRSWAFPIVYNDENIGQYTYQLGSSLSAGSHLWMRGYFYFPTGFSWQSGGGTPSDWSIVKLMRFSVANSNNTAAHYLSLEENNDGFGGCSDFNLGYISLASEGFTGVACQNKNLPADLLTTGTWHALEMYVYLSSTGTGIFRAWHNGILISEYTGLNTIPSGGFIPQSTTSDWAESHILGWWNAAPTRNQTIYFDDWKITNEQPTSQDSFGNHMIGPTDWDGGDTTAPATTISTSDPSAISSDTLTVIGSASDAVGVSGCKWRLGGAPTSSAGTSCTGTTSFSCSTSGYSSGANALHVACYDAAGIYGDDSITVNYTPPAGSGITPGNLILSESFEDSSFSSRNWYDGGSTDIVSGGQSGNCLRWAWTSGGSTPASMTTMRRQFTAQNKVLVRAYLKLDANWQGLQETYGGPHVMHVMGTVDGLYDGLSYADLNTYIEFYTNVGSPYTTYTRFQMQDSERIVTSPTPPTNLVSSTETRAVAGCNGDQGDAGSIVSCWEDGGDWFNGRIWDNTSAAVLKNEWVLVDTYMEMNTISNSVANANGKVRQWVNGTLVKSSDTVVFRTGDQPTKQFDKLILAPFMGSSPITQTMWVDELKIYDGYTSGAGAQIGSGGASFGSGGGSFR